MSWRWQPPVYSPLSLRCLVAAVGAALARSGAGVGSLQAKLAAEFGTDRVLLTDSGTSALTLAIRGALASRQGAPVALPAYGCYDLVTAAEGAGATVVLYDVDPATLGPDWESLKRALHAGPAAVVIAHLFGVPVDFTRVRAALGPRGILLIDDAAQGIAARFGGRRLGTLGDLGVLSFGRGKGLTGGGGGALLATSPAGSRALESVGALRSSGRPGSMRVIAGLAAQWMLARPLAYRIPASVPALGLGNTVYRSPRPPMAPAAASEGAVMANWADAFEEAEVRRRNGERFASVAGTLAVSIPPRADPGFLRFPIVLRERSPARADRRLGIWPGYPLALADLPGLSERYLNRDEAFQGARRLARRLVTLPTHSILNARDLVALDRWIANAAAASAG